MRIHLLLPRSFNQPWILRFLMKLNEVNTKLDRFKPRNTMMSFNFIYFKPNMIKFLKNTKNPKTENPNWNRVWWMNWSIDWGLLIVDGAETKWPRVFWTGIKESQSSKLSFLPVQAEIENWIGVLPVVILWFLEHQRPSRIMYEWSAHHEFAWIVLTKSTCIQLKVKLEIEVRGVTGWC